MGIVIVALWLLGCLLAFIELMKGLPCYAERYKNEPFILALTIIMMAFWCFILSWIMFVMLKREQK